MDRSTVENWIGLPTIFLVCSWGYELVYLVNHGIDLQELGYEKNRTITSFNYADISHL